MMIQQDIHDDVADVFMTDRKLSEFLVTLTTMNSTLNQFLLARFRL